MPTIRSPHMIASFHDRTGHWESLRLSDGVNLLHTEGSAFGISVNGRPALPATRRLVTAVTDPMGRACDLLYVQADMRIVHRVELHNAKPVMKQSILVEVLTGQSLPRRVTDVWFRLPGFALDERRNNFLHLSDQMPRPYHPLPQPIKLIVDPNTAPALVAMENRAIQEAEHIVAAWQQTVHPAEIRLTSEDVHLVAEFHLPVSDELKPGSPLQWTNHFTAVADIPSRLLDPEQRQALEF